MIVPVIIVFVLAVIMFYVFALSMARAAELRRLKTYIQDLENIHQLPDFFPAVTFKKFLDRELERCERYNKEFSLVSFCGDIKLQGRESEIAAILRGSLRSFDVLCVENEDGFILLPETAASDVHTIVSRIGKKLDEKFENFHAHFGIVSYPHDATLMEDMVEKAVQTMETARKTDHTVLTYSDIY